MGIKERQKMSKAELKKFIKWVRKNKPPIKDYVEKHYVKLGSVVKAVDQANAFLENEKMIGRRYKDKNGATRMRLVIINIEAPLTLADVARMVDEINDKK